MVGGHVIEKQRQAGEHPAVAAAPEDLLAVWRPQADEPVVTVEQLLLRVVERLQHRLELAVDEPQVATVPGPLVRAANAGGAM